MMKQLHFTLVEDTYQPEQDKRWVVVAPPGMLENGSCKNELAVDLNIAQSKAKCGLEKRENYKKGKEGHRVPNTPPEKGKL